MSRTQRGGPWAHRKQGRRALLLLQLHNLALVVSRHGAHARPSASAASAAPPAASARHEACSLPAFGLARRLGRTDEMPHSESRSIYMRQTCRRVCRRRRRCPPPTWRSCRGTLLRCCSPTAGPPSGPPRHGTLSTAGSRTARSILLEAAAALSTAGSRRCAPGSRCTPGRSAGPHMVGRQCASDSAAARHPSPTAPGKGLTRSQGPWYVLRAGTPAVSEGASRMPPPYTLSGICTTWRRPELRGSREAEGRGQGQGRGAGQACME